MAGHSKWANIKHRKSAQDARRGKMFTRLIREITVAARQGAKPDDNPRLRGAVEKGLAANMSRDLIQRAIDRGAGVGDADQLREESFEGYGPGGIAILVETMSDNHNRTVAEVRHTFRKYGGNLGTDGSVAWLFERRGELLFAAETDGDQLMDVAVSAGANDISVEDDGSLRVFTDVSFFDAVTTACRDQELTPAAAELNMVPSSTVSLVGKESEQALQLLNALEDLDDTQDVFTNAEFADAPD